MYIIINIYIYIHSNKGMALKLLDFAKKKLYIYVCNLIT